MESKVMPKISKNDEGPERAVLKCHKCGRASRLANTCIKKTKINEAQVIEEFQCVEEKEESDQDSEISDYTQADYYPLERITAFFEVMKSILTCHNRVNNARAQSISKRLECVRLNLLEEKVTLLEHLVLHQS
ncbi:hypothetical protein O181_046499 [Austropuccinia psidii MF-1]|uniref:Uncharacterized protein n=1 Tax=Austropuccinia psidii MF-1 TaxID=1389203 RepID=A0A9Q3HLA4_9BASI|nr:hypothetical protein [Austropuccinia psidii MF-1]